MSAIASHIWNIRASQFSLASAASRCREAAFTSIHFVQTKLITLYKETHCVGKNTAPQHRNSHCFVPYSITKGGKIIMILYKELSSLTDVLGVSAKALYAASNHKNSHYHQTKIPKGNGEYRELTVPDDFMKLIQKRIVERLLVYEEISPYSTAYRYGGSTIINARPHLRNTTVLKLDIRHFF